MIYKYNKLVRDKIPEEIENQGKECKYEILDDEKYSKELDKKLLEEVNEYNVGGLEVDLEKRRIFLNKEEVHFTPIEFKIFSLLVRHAGKVLTHNYIIKEVWGGVVGGENQSLRVFMANIRRKIEKEPANPRFLLTEVGVGYRLVDEWIY